MSVQRCVEFAREFGAADADARELCRDPQMQRCAEFFRPQPGDDLSQNHQLDNLIACYGTRSSTERGT